MSRTKRWSLVTVVALATTVLLFILFFDWNLLRGYIGKKVTEATGREFVIRGNLDVDLGLTPRIYMEDVHFANSPWGKEAEMLRIPKTQFTLSLRSLLRGNVVIPEVRLSQPYVALEKSPSGERNWVLKKKQRAEDAPPEIGRLTVDRGTLIFHDPATKTHIESVVWTTAPNAQSRVTRFDAKGKFKGLAATAVGEGGSVLRLQDASVPFPIRATVKIADTKAAFNGTITGLTKFSAANLHLTLSGSDLSQLFPLIRVSLPVTPPYKFSGHLVHYAKIWRYNNFTGRVGDSDLNGRVMIDNGRARRFMEAKLSSKLLDFDDLGGFIGAAPGTGPGETASAAQKALAATRAQRAAVLPDKAFRVERLQAMDADVTYNAKAIRSKGLPLDDLSTHLILDNGKLTLNPLDFGVAGGNIKSRVEINSHAKPMRASIDAQFSKLQLNQLFPKIQLTKTSVGHIGGRAKLAGEGSSIAKLLATSDGRVGLAMSGGRVSALLVEIIGIDGGEIIKFIFGGDKNIEIRCAAGEFAVKNGEMNTEVFVFDTVDTNVSGEGTISLKNETLNLTLRPEPKDMSILSLRAPLHVTGTFKKPQFKPDMGTMVRRGGAALLLGAVNPLAALIPLIETGPGQDSDCKSLLAHVNQSGRTRKSK